MTVAVERLVVGALVAGFAIGTATHTLQLVSRGWVVFASAPVWMNVYWTALTLLDPLAAVLLICARRAGLLLALAIMVSDVAVNSYALYGLGLPLAVWALQLQNLFLGFLLGAAGFLWTRGQRDHRLSHDGRAASF